MDLSQITTTSNPTGVQGRNQDNQHLSVMVSRMEIRFSNAQEAGQLTGDQADKLKKIFEELADILSNNQSGPAGELSADDRTRIRHGLHDARQLLYAALQGQDSTGLGTNAADALFGKMDANNDGAIGKDEFSSFLNSRMAGNSSINHPQSVPAVYGQSGSFQVSMSLVRSTFSVSA